MDRLRLLLEYGIDIEKRTIYVTDEIDQYTTEKILKGINIIEGEEPIRIVINSFGGSAYDGIAIYNILNKCSREIITVNAGSVMSAALAIFMAGERRVCLENARFMFHEASESGFETSATASDKKNDAKELDLINQIIKKTMVDGSNKTQSFWTRKMSQDYYFGKQEALDFGIVTQE